MFAKEWKAVMERPSGAELRSSPKANRTFVPRKHTGEPARGSPLPHCWNDEQTFSQNKRSDPLDRGCPSRRRKISRGAAEARRMFAKIWKAVMERPSGAELRFLNNRVAVEYL